MDRREPQEGYDWAEYEAYLDGGVEGVILHEIETINAELAFLGDGLLMVMGQIEAALILEVNSVMIPLAVDITEFLMILGE